MYASESVPSFRAYIRFISSCARSGWFFFPLPLLFPPTAPPNSPHFVHFHLRRSVCARSYRPQPVFWRLLHDWQPGFAVRLRHDAPLISASREIASFDLPRTDQAFLIKTDQIRSACRTECFQYQIIVFGLRYWISARCIAFSCGLVGTLHFFHRARIISRVIHTRRQCGWRRIEILHLLRHVAEVAQIFCQFDRLLERGTRMGRTSGTERGYCFIPSESFIAAYSFMNWR